MVISIKKEKSLILKENLASQRPIASKLEISSATASKIHKDLQLKNTFKPKVHLFMPKHIAERKSNCKKFYKKHTFALKNGNGMEKGTQEPWTDFGKDQRKMG